MLAQLGRNDVSYLVKIDGVNAKEYGHRGMSQEKAGLHV